MGRPRKGFTSKPSDPEYQRLTIQILNKTQWTLEELGEALHVTKQAIGRWANGKVITELSENEITKLRILNEKLESIESDYDLKAFLITLAAGGLWGWIAVALGLGLSVSKREDNIQEKYDQLLLNLEDEDE